MPGPGRQRADLGAGLLHTSPSARFRSTSGYPDYAPTTEAGPRISRYFATKHQKTHGRRLHPSCQIELATAADATSEPLPLRTNLNDGRGVRTFLVIVRDSGVLRATAGALPGAY
jgi:hypothetical protein